LNEICNKICIGRHISDAFPIQKGPKQRDALLPLLSNFTLECAITKVQEYWDSLELQWNTASSVG